MIANEREIVIGASSIHATHHTANGNRFVVVAPPLFEESVRLRKALVNLSRYLCSHGFDVVRFDYGGTGLSNGRYEDLTLGRAGADLGSALEYCREQGGVDPAIVGARFGGYAALRAVAEGRAKRAVVWEPVVDPQAYIREVLRAEVATQMLIYGEVRQDREALVEMLQTDGRILVEGYAMGRGLYDEFCEASAFSGEGNELADGQASFIYWQTRREHKRWQSSPHRVHWIDGVRLAFNHIRQLEPGSEALFQITHQELTRDD